MIVGFQEEKDFSRKSIEEAVQEERKKTLSLLEEERVSFLPLKPIKKISVNQKAGFVHKVIYTYKALP